MCMSDSAQGGFEQRTTVRCEPSADGRPRMRGGTRETGATVAEDVAGEQGNGACAR